MYWLILSQIENGRKKWLKKKERRFVMWLGTLCFGTMTVTFIGIFFQLLPTVFPTVLTTALLTVLLTVLATVLLTVCGQLWKQFFHLFRADFWALFGPI
jgi:hypothetical protein